MLTILLYIFALFAVSNNEGSRMSHFLRKNTGRFYMPGVFKIAVHRFAVRHFHFFNYLLLSCQFFLLVLLCLADVFLHVLGKVQGLELLVGGQQHGKLVRLVQLGLALFNSQF